MSKIKEVDLNKYLKKVCKSSNNPLTGRFGRSAWLAIAKLLGNPDHMLNVKNFPVVVEDGKIISE